MSVVCHLHRGTCVMNRRHIVRTSFVGVLATGVLCLVSLNLLLTWKEHASHETLRELKWVPSQRIVCAKKTKSDGGSQLKWNLTALKPPSLLPNFKNPCFHANVTLPDFPPLQTTEQLRCLPHFLIAGFPKCGTSDVWVRLRHHPDIVVRHIKELNFFNRKMLVGDFQTAFTSYLNTFTKTTLQLQALVSPALCQGTFPYHHGITGEGSVDTAVALPRWQDAPENKDCPEPRITNADYVRRLMPNIKILLLVRNPVDSLIFADCKPEGYLNDPHNLPNRRRIESKRQKALNDRFYETFVIINTFVIMFHNSVDPGQTPQNAASDHGRTKHYVSD